jgi:excisionase family DNA binding protein
MQTSLPKYHTDAPFTTEKRFAALLSASPAQLKRIDAVLTGAGEPDVSGTPARPVRLLTVSDAARETGLSRATLYRLMHTGALKARRVLGSPRLSADDLAQIGVSGGAS